MRRHPLFLIAGMIVIAAQLTGCGQNGSTGGGTNATPAPTNVPSPAVTNTPLPTASTGPVILRVGATTYHASDTISVTLSNQSTRAIYFPDHLTNCTVILLQRQVIGGWQSVNVCKLMTPTGLHKLEAGKSLTVDLTSPPSLWGVGLYRAMLRYGSAQTFGGSATTLYSAGFQVVAWRGTGRLCRLIHCCPAPIRSLKRLTSNQVRLAPIAMPRVGGMHRLPLAMTQPTLCSHDA
jgi:hypothetical protein